MSRWFNIAGPCRADKHYMLPPTSRLPDLDTLIEQESYFVVHAPRQTGKTTAMLALAIAMQQLWCPSRLVAHLTMTSVRQN